jgi:hypothetical protein
MAAVSNTRHNWWSLSLARSSYCAISEEKISPNLLSVHLSRRFWYWGFYCCSFLVYARILNACKVSLKAIQVLVIPWACTGYDELLWWCWWCSWLKLDPWLLVMFLSVACPAPPCAWPPTWLALHLLGAWLAPCCAWSWLCNHIVLALIIGLIWWGEASPDAQLMSRENLCYGVAVLWCCGCCRCCGCCGCCGCWSTRVSWSTSFALAEPLYTSPLAAVGLTPMAMHLVTSCLLASWLGRPDWFKQIFWEWVMLIRSSPLMIINSDSFKFGRHLYCHGGFSLCFNLCMQVTKIWRGKKKD